MDFLRNLFGRKKPSTPQTPGLEPAVIVSPRVLTIIFDPIMTPAGEKLSKLAHWGAHETLAGQFINDILECSGGLARYQLVERIEVTSSPSKWMDSAIPRKRTPMSCAALLRRTIPIR